MSTTLNLSSHAIGVMALTVSALFLFTRERIPIEATSLFILIALTVGFEVFPYVGVTGAVHPDEFFSGFGHEALITICALMIVGRGLEVTGALEPIARLMARTWVSHPKTSLLVLLVLTGLLSGVMNNTPIVVMLLPILISVSMRTRQPASKSLMPMGMATILGGSSTTIGTSTNLLVVAIAADLGVRRFGMFDFTIPALIAGAVGIVYLWLFAPRFLPLRETPLEDASPLMFDSILHIGEDSAAASMTLSEALKKTENRMKVAQIQRGEDLFIVKLPTAQLRAGDRLYVTDTRENLKSYEGLLGATLHNVFDLEHPVNEEHPLKSDGQQLAEIVVREGSPLYDTTVKRARFAEQYNVVIQALHRAQEAGSGAPMRTGIADVLLRAGDVLLVQGPKESIKELKSRGGMLVLDGTVDLPHTAKAPIAVAIFLVVVSAAAFGILPISISALLGVGLVLLTRCLTWRGAADALSTPVIMIIVASLALGAAMTLTGGADVVALLLVHYSAGVPPVFVLSGLMLFMAVLGNVVSHNAAAVIGTPIAIRIAQELGVSAEPFVLAVMFGANMGYATPIAYQTNVLILNAGGYKFTDFLRVGVPLVLIMWATLSYLLPIFFAL